MSIPTLVWKPLDMGGFRLYKVILHRYLKGQQRAKRDHYTVAASSPSQAAKIIEQRLKVSLDANPAISHWHVTGHALDVLQPRHWYEEGVPCLDCEPKRFRKWRAE